MPESVPFLVGRRRVGQVVRDEGLRVDGHRRELGDAIVVADRVRCVLQRHVLVHLLAVLVLHIDEHIDLLRFSTLVLCDLLR